METQETAARDAAPPPGGSGSTTDTQPVAVSSSAVGVVPPPSDCESAAPGADEPTAIQKSAAGHDTAGEDSKVPGGPGTTAGRTVVAQEFAAAAGTGIAPRALSKAATTMKRTNVTGLARCRMLRTRV